ncbi:unnamed protein product [Echinostoma caproni]|uniref:DUF3421 domain-containing protein n=1 Tax=Echinostoma caproni TaxID=27848 RepID=A0A183AE71_9TREM|nr:unnamed protein product [Echinostoma caproni]
MKHAKLARGMKRDAALVALSANRSISEIAKFLKVSRSFVYRLKKDPSGFHNKKSSVPTKGKLSRKLKIPITQQCTKTAWELATHEVSLSWLPVDADRNVPANAIEAGSGLYVIRARQGRNTFPGKWSGKMPYASISYDGEEFKVTDFEVLCDTSIIGSMPRKTMKNASLTRGMKRHAVLVALRANRDAGEIEKFLRVSRSFVYRLKSVHKDSGKNKSSGPVTNRRSRYSEIQNDVPCKKMASEVATHEATLSWIPVDANWTVRLNAIEANPGFYVIRARQGLDTVPGKWSGNIPYASIPYGNKELKVTEFEVLCDSFFGKILPA